MPRRPGLTRHCGPGLGLGLSDSGLGLPAMPHWHWQSHESLLVPGRHAGVTVTVGTGVTVTVTRDGDPAGRGWRDSDHQCPDGTLRVRDSSLAYDSGSGGLG